MSFWTDFSERFRFVKHWRERADTLRHENQLHQLAVITASTKALEVLIEGQVRQTEESTKALLAIAAASSSQADAFGSWIKSFQVTEAPTSSVVRDEDEIKLELARYAEHFGEDIPEEFRLAHQLHREEFITSVRNDTGA